MEALSDLVGVMIYRLLGKKYFGHTSFLIRLSEPTAYSTAFQMPFTSETCPPRAKTALSISRAPRVAPESYFSLPRWSLAHHSSAVSAAPARLRRANRADTARHVQRRLRLGV